MRQRILSVGMICALMLLSITPPVGAQEKDTKNGKAAGTTEAGAAEEKAKAKSENKPAAKKKVTVARLTVKGALSESVSQAGLFGELEQNLAKLIDRLDSAARDDKLSAVVLRLRTPSIGRGKLAEIRAAVARTKQAGKKVYAEIHLGMPADYLIASACDEIVMPESGGLFLPGIRAEIMFYKGLFEKLGIEADMLQVGAYKGAAEPYMRKGMSPEFRGQYELVLDDMYAQMVETIAADRKLDKDKVKKLIDRGLFTPQAAKKAGLIDRVAYDDELQAGLKKSLEADELVLIDKYGKKKVDTEFSGMLGMLKLFELMMGVETKPGASGKKRIAIVYAVGPIMSGKSSASIFGGATMGSETIVGALRKAAEDKSVVAIVLRVDSPGGSGLASDQIWRQIQQIEKPVVASMGDIAASGGYYISMGCDKIYAEDGTLTGSIGVVGGKIALGGLYNKFGLTTESISRGKNSGLFSSDAPFSKSERKAMQEYMDEFYKQFVTKAAEGRKMTPKELEPLAAGRIWTGRQAKERGLVDQVGTLEDAIAEARRLAGLKPEDKTERLLLPKPQSIFDQLLEGPSIRVDARPLAASIAPEIAEQLGDVETIRKLFAEPAVLMLPYRVRIR